MPSKKFIERRALDAFLLRLSQIEGQTPSSIEESERPDFIVTLSNKIIGIETTQTVYQEVVRALKMQASLYPHKWVNLTHLDDGRPRPKNSELARSFGYSGLWQGGKSPEETMLDWKQKIADALDSKRRKLDQTGYQIFEENWLLIYDFPPQPVDWLTRELLFRHLTDIFSQSPTSGRDFEKIFIHSGDWLFRQAQGSLEFN